MKNDKLLMKSVNFVQNNGYGMINIEIFVNIKMRGRIYEY